nr:NB-ARC domains-containing protein [Tanacetum cinerariifolium]
MAAALLPIVFEKLASVLENKIARSNEIHSELKKWERSLSLIQAFLEDASQKEVKSKAVKHKLDDISTRLQELMEEKEKLGLSVKNGGSKDKNRCYSEHLRKRGFWKQNYHHNSKERIELRQHGEGIIKKCDGLPLALEALGRLLRNRTDEEEWKRLLDNEIWMLEDEGGILLALRLIYHDLSACLKQLLAYCCLIPKDYVFKKKDLILWWMAEGFLHNSNTNKTMECLGGEYFSRAAVKRVGKLHMGWSNVFDDSRNEKLENEVLDALKPHSDNLKDLVIESYGGNLFPNWIGDPSFFRLTSVRIEKCGNCTNLPPLGELM